MSEKTLADYEIIKKLGEGAFGTVYKAKRKSDKKIISLKIIEIDKGKIKDAEKEVKFLKNLSKPKCNPFVVCYYDSFYDEKGQKFVIEMEYIDGSEMYDFVLDRSKEDVDKFYRLLVAIAKDASEGLKYVHSKGIIHGDIKLENIMIERDTNIPKIIDFGLACNMKLLFLESGQYCVSFLGSPLYLAPEVIKEQRKYPASDMWALGVTLYAAATGETYPIDLTKSERTGNLVMQLFTKISTTEPSKLNTSNKTLNKIVNGLLIKDPTKRLTPDGVLNLIKESSNGSGNNPGKTYTN